jgi:hypothetical protein
MPDPVWRPATRVAFRFSLVYFGLYIITTQMLTSLLQLPAWGFAELGTLPPAQAVVTRVASHLFGVTDPLVVTASGSGDKIFDWVQAFCLLVIALLATAGWTILDRRRECYGALHGWFHLFVRFALGATMVTYGASKAIPLQMGAGPSLGRLVEPFGHFSPMGVLWSFMGVSPAYQSFTGCAELLGGMLLFLPRTATIGALVCLADAIQVFTLNMTYDVPVKLMSFHLVLLSLFLLAPDAARLAKVFLAPRPPLLRGARADRLARVAQVAIGIYLVGLTCYSLRQQWMSYGGGAPKSLLYGIWSVEEMSVDGKVLAPLLTDHDRWRRIVFDSPKRAAFHRMDDSIEVYRTDIDPDRKSMVLIAGTTLDRKSTIAFEQPAADRLVLEGDMEGHRVRMQLLLEDREKFPLVSRGFHWVQEYPFNR